MKKNFNLFRTLSDDNLPLSEALEAQDEESNDINQTTQDISRIIHSLIEEFAAVNDYNMRMDATKNKELRDILEHNRDEETEHAFMLLNLLKKLLPVVETKIQKFLINEEKD